MDGLIVTAAVILAVIALIEVVTFFFMIPGECRPVSLTVLPVFGGDPQFSMRLEYLLRRCGSGMGVILVDYSADEAQAELCRQFIRNAPDAVFISQQDLEKIFAETFAISEKI